MKEKEKRSGSLEQGDDIIDAVPVIWTDYKMVNVSLIRVRLPMKGRQLT